MSSVGEANTRLKIAVDKIVKDIGKQVVSRGTRAVMALRNAELEVLSGTRSGKVYKLPGTHGEKADKVTRRLKKDYGHKLRRGQLYRASAPGEAPANRLGDLRKNWDARVKGENTSGNQVKVSAELESRMDYSARLDEGSKNGKIKPRPFKNRIIEKATPKIKAIYNEPYK